MTKTNILEMTHEELVNSSEQIKQEYREQRMLIFYTIVENYFESGHNHVQIGQYSCIIKKKNRNGIYYVTRNGLGTGRNTGGYTTLKDATDNLYRCGHYDTYTKISVK